MIISIDKSKVRKRNYRAFDLIALSLFKAFLRHKFCFLKSAAPRLIAAWGYYNV